jgi:hypothetical protein
MFEFLVSFSLGPYLKYSENTLVLGTTFFFEIITNACVDCVLSFLLIF